ncbi:MAG: DinB family protein [Planctomycetota bacterium]|jgi:uncharacterized damage-inducible protein DinB
MNPDQAIAQSLIACFRKHMLEEYLPRIRSCVEMLSADELWRRPSTHGNSIANLLIHLAGNTRQWILCGLGGEEDKRDRSSEFAAEAGETLALMDRLEETVQAAVTVVEGLSAEDLLEDRDFQGGRYRGNGVSGVVHVLEHFSGHAGQIYAFTKQLKDIDLRFYSHLE